MDMDNNNHIVKQILLVCIVIIFCIVAVVAFFYIQNQSVNTSPSVTNDVEENMSFYNNLLKKNTNFESAEQLFSARKYTESITEYTRALESTTDIKEEGQIKYKLALAHEYNNQPIEAIVNYKEVVANESYARQLRAYAVQRMIGMLYSYNTQEVRDEIYKGEPYESFIVERRSLTDKKLVEYGSLIQPLGVLELRLAGWYVDDYIRLSSLNSTDAVVQNEIQSLKSLIQQKIINADAYIVAISNDPQQRNYLPEVLRRKAMILGDLYIAGDSDFSDPEEAFRKAIQASIISVGDEATTKFRYAVFLGKMYGEERSDEIKALLSDFYETSRYAQTSVVRMIRSEKDGGAGSKVGILLLAEIDSRFGEYLKTLGWTI